MSRKSAPTGQDSEYGGFIGGNDEDAGLSIAVDDNGAAYITGFTWSSQGTFPVAGGPDLTFNRTTFGPDAFVAKVSPSGDALEYAGYIGGGDDEEGHGIAVDAAGAAYVTG